MLPTVPKDEVNVISVPKHIKAYRGREDEGPKTLNLGTRLEASGQFHASTALTRRKESPILTD
jgi:hypothetical protein